MRTINALSLRNQLGAVLDELERTKEPVIVSKGRTPRAVLITVEDFQRRFLDKQTEERRKELLERVRQSRSAATGGKDSLAVLRDLRGGLS